MMSLLRAIDRASGYAFGPAEGWSGSACQISRARVARTRFPVLGVSRRDLVLRYNFETLAVEDKKSMMSLLRAIDRASGYAFGPAEGIPEFLVRESRGLAFQFWE
jgi:hypothetical protein